VFAALTRNGDSAPPAPSEDMAFHSPGAKNPTAPITKALKSVLRYQIRFPSPFWDSKAEEDDIVVSPNFPLGTNYEETTKPLGTLEIYVAHGENFS
jgi:hypothetical protein